ncbi:hypothetical protein ACWCYY_38960 [Kitasatospora sp. NPDC001664]
MRKSTLQRAAALLIGAGAILATSTTGSVAAPAAGKSEKPAPVVRTMPKAPAAKALKSAPNAAPSDSEAPQVAFLMPGQRLESGSSLNAGSTTLVMQTDGNLVLYLVATDGSRIQALWSSRTWNNPGAYATMQTDGNFVVYRQGGGPTTGGGLWSTSTWNHPDSYFALALGDLLVGPRTGGDPFWSNGTGALPEVVNGAYTGKPSSKIESDLGLLGGMWVESRTTILLKQNDGNVVLYRKSDGRPIWSTGTWNQPESFAYMNPDGAFEVLTEFGTPWSTNTHGNPGAYVIAQEDGNFVLYRQNGGPNAGGALWSSGTWGKA